MEDTCINLWVHLFRDSSFAGYSAKLRIVLSVGWLRLFPPIFPIVLAIEPSLRLRLSTQQAIPSVSSLLPIQEL
jgi:hypothetical protein